jgi:hypothetical protein
MSHITDKVNAGSVSTSQYLPSSFRIHPHRIHPVSVAEKALESLSSPSPFGGDIAKRATEDFSSWSEDMDEWCITINVVCKTNITYYEI